MTVGAHLPAYYHSWEGGRRTGWDLCRKTRRRAGRSGGLNRQKEEHGGGRGGRTRGDRCWGILCPPCLSPQVKNYHSPPAAPLASCASYLGRAPCGAVGMIGQWAGVDDGRGRSSQ